MQADIELFLARLLTDRDLRERFLADPAGIGSEHGLSPAECVALAQLPKRDVRTAARSYERKRESKRSQNIRSRLVKWLQA